MLGKSRPQLNSNALHHIDSLLLPCHTPFMVKFLEKNKFVTIFHIFALTQHFMIFVFFVSCFVECWYLSIFRSKIISCNSTRNQVYFYQECICFSFMLSFRFLFYMHAEYFYSSPRFIVSPFSLKDACKSIPDIKTINCTQLSIFFTN